MTNHDAVMRIMDAMEALAVPHMLVGSLSSNAYGMARSTQDADFVIETSADAISTLFNSLGPPFCVDRQISFETITGTLRYHVLVEGSAFKIELFLLSNDPFDRERFSRRSQVDYMDRRVWLPSAEDVVIQKLRWSKQGRRTKDVDDARNVIAVQGDALDWTYIHRWCEEHGTRALLDQIRESIPKDI